MSASSFEHPRTAEEANLFQQLEKACTLLQSYYPLEWNMLLSYQRLFMDTEQRIQEATLQTIAQILFYQGMYYALNIYFLTNQSDTGALCMMEKLLVEKQDIYAFSFTELLQETLAYCRGLVEMQRVQDEQRGIVYMEHKLMDGKYLQELFQTGEYRFHLTIPVEAEVEIEPYKDDDGNITPIVQLKFPSSPFINEEKFLTYHLSSLQDVIRGFFITENIPIIVEELHQKRDEIAEEEALIAAYREAQETGLDIDDFIRTSLQALREELWGATSSVMELWVEKVADGEPYKHPVEVQLAMLLQACARHNLFPAQEIETHSNMTS
jgi:hypothetical protein